MYKRVLLIDDDEATNFVNSFVVKKAQLAEQVNTVQTASGGLDILKTPGQIPQIIFLDINMPEMTGWDFLEEFGQLDTEVTSKVKIYMLSSSQSDEDVQRANSHKLVSGFIHKPLNTEQLTKLFDN